MRFAIWLAFFLLFVCLASSAEAGPFGRRSGGAAFCMNGSCGASQATTQTKTVYRRQYSGSCGASAGDEVFLGRTRFRDGDGRPFRKAR